MTVTATGFTAATIFVIMIACFIAIVINERTYRRRRS